MKEVLHGLPSWAFIRRFNHTGNGRDTPEPEDKNMEQLDTKKLKNVTPNKEDNSDAKK